ncbi:hypothetical protein DSO57_1009848 [Entomophthora muscae]|nr:hypothetical protein DSO57_1035031 [Entomophthora muscae]KAJ9078154.1 hypothetical protein DSO57_1009848 [Entomophthora muscae]
MEYSNIDNRRRTTITQHNMSIKEILHSYANQLLYSRSYTIFYLSLIILTLVTMILSIVEQSKPSTMFFVLEIIINVAMILEVALRIFALGYAYWDSKSNIFDIILVVVCIITLIIVATSHSKGAKNEEVVETVILGVRNIVQVIRLCVAIRK